MTTPAIRAAAAEAAARLLAEGKGIVPDRAITAIVREFKLELLAAVAEAAPERLSKASAGRLRALTRGGVKSLDPRLL